MENGLEAILEFLAGLGMPVRLGETTGKTFFPGVRIVEGGLVVDLARLKHPGDILHEAGHLAAMEPERRARTTDDAGPNGGEELASTGWSYAVAVHLRLDPAVVFHEDSYRGDGDSLLENFAEGRWIGVPLLQLWGMTLDEKNARQSGAKPYPHMRRWLRE
ncbi:MAG TPA: hypothetical protein VGZ73_28345 [Bryobacteraceae bacterium]|nr:hypothetical protein [Bryobacteraceae bacterium]